MEDLFHVNPKDDGTKTDGRRLAKDSITNLLSFARFCFSCKINQIVSLWKYIMLISNGMER